MSAAELWKCVFPVPVYAVGERGGTLETGECGRYLYRETDEPAPECPKPGGGHGKMTSQGIFEFEGSFA